MVARPHLTTFVALKLCFFKVTARFGRLKCWRCLNSEGWLKGTLRQVWGSSASRAGLEDSEFCCIGQIELH